MSGNNQKNNWDPYKVTVKPCRDCVLYIKWDKRTAESIFGKNMPLRLDRNEAHEHNSLDEAGTTEQQTAQNTKAVAGYINLLNGTTPTGQNDITQPNPSSNPPAINNIPQPQHQILSHGQNTNAVSADMINEVFKQNQQILANQDLILMKLGILADFKDLFTNFGIKVVEMLNDQRIDAESNLANFQEMLQKPQFKTANDIVSE